MVFGLVNVALVAFGCFEVIDVGFGLFGGEFAVLLEEREKRLVDVVCHA